MFVGQWRVGKMAILPECSQEAGMAAARRPRAETRSNSHDRPSERP
jgi:hypothetical protein